MASHRWIANRSVGKSDSDGTGNINSNMYLDNTDSNQDTQESYMAAVLGTAGHIVIETMHKKDKFNFPYLDIYEIFSSSFDLAKQQTPNIHNSISYSSQEEEVDDKENDYIEMLQGYQELQQRNKFVTVSSEQQFTFTYNHNNTSYLFHGSTDHIGYYTTGELAGFLTIRDIKFRDRKLKPSWIERALNLQMTVYAYALKYGVPCCKYCAPYYDNNLLNYEVIYNGPCDNCRQQIGTKSWPQEFPERCELIWMRDFNKYKRKYGKHKPGDYYGPGVYTVNRTPTTLEAYMQQVIKLVDSFCTGLNYRRPGMWCNTMCHYRQECISGLNIIESEEMF